MRLSDVGRGGKGREEGEREKWFGVRRIGDVGAFESS